MRCEMDIEKEIMDMKNRIAQLEADLSEQSKLFQKRLTWKNTVFGFIGSFLITIILINIIFYIVSIVSK
jgi:hypothetical protein